MSQVNIITDDIFDQEVLASDKPTLVSFTATWSEPSQNFSKLLRTVAERHDDIKFAKIDVGGKNPAQVANDNPVSAERYNIKGFPTALMFHGGKVAGIFFGEITEDELDKWLDEVKDTPAENRLSVEQYRDYTEDYFQKAEVAAKDYANKVQARNIKISRRLTMAFALARGVGAFALSTVVPGPLTVLMGTAILAPASLTFLNAFTKKDEMPQEVSFTKKPLRLAFNIASLMGGLMLAASAPDGIALTAGAAILGVAIAWPAFKNIWNDVGESFTTDLNKYPVTRPEKPSEGNPSEEKPLEDKTLAEKTAHDLLPPAPRN